MLGGRRYGLGDGIEVVPLDSVWELGGVDPAGRG